MPPHRELNQVGMNMMVWHMLKAMGGSFTISNKVLEGIDPNVAVRVDHKASTDTFTLTLQRLQDMAKDKSIIIQPHLVGGG